MNVGFLFTDCENKMAGIGRYSKGITEALDNELVKKYTFSTQYVDIENMKRLEQVYKPNVMNDLYLKEQCVLAKANNIEIIHSFYQAIPKFDYKGIRTILTIHDLIPIVNYNMDWYINGDYVYNYFDCTLRDSARGVDKIVTVSEYTKSTIVDYYGIDANKIAVIVPGVQQVLDNYIPLEEDIEFVKNKYNINAQYLLSVCTLEPRKNLPMLIRAYDKYRDKYKESGIKLVLTGKLGWKYDGIMEQIKSSKYVDSIILTDYVTDEELAILYKGALCFAYISLFEGFGAPILEALSKGKAVLTSNVSSMPEVGGDAVCYCDPTDIESVYSSLERLLEDATYRHDLENRSIEQAKKFTYKKSADKLLKEFQDLL